MTDRPFGLLEPDAYLRHLRRAADRIIAVAGDALATPVPACPEWTVRDVLDHLGQVHHLIEAMVATGEPPEEKKVMPADAEPVEWYAEQVNRMLTTFAVADPLCPCETFQPGNQYARYWFRRQAHEVAMHGADVARAADVKVDYAPELAADGIGEVLDVWLSAATTAVGPPTLTAPLLLACADRPERWLLTPTNGSPETLGPAAPDRHGAAEIHGTAVDLVRALWKRHPDGPLTVTGDCQVANEFLASTLTP